MCVRVVVGASNTMLPNLSGLALPGGDGGPVAPMETAGLKEMKQRLQQAKLKAKDLKTKIAEDPKLKENVETLLTHWEKLGTDVIYLVSASGSAAVDKAIDLANFVWKSLRNKETTSPFADPARIQKIRAALRQNLKSPGSGGSISLNGPIALDTGAKEKDEDAGKQLAIEVIFDFLFCVIMFCIEYTASGENLTQPVCYGRWGLA